MGTRQPGDVRSDRMLSIVRWRIPADASRCIE